MDGLLVDSEPLWFEVERDGHGPAGRPVGPGGPGGLIGGSLDRSIAYMRRKAAQRRCSRRT